LPLIIAGTFRIRPRNLRPLEPGRHGLAIEPGVELLLLQPEIALVAVHAFVELALLQAERPIRIGLSAAGFALTEAEIARVLLLVELPVGHGAERRRRLEVAHLERASHGGAEVDLAIRSSRAVQRVIDGAALAVSANAVANVAEAPTKSTVGFP
jgi:hypothetical protein